MLELKIPRYDELPRTQELLMRNNHNKNKLEKVIASIQNQIAAWLQSAWQTLIESDATIEWPWHLKKIDVLVAGFDWKDVANLTPIAAHTIEARFMSFGYKIEEIKVFENGNEHDNKIIIKIKKL